MTGNSIELHSLADTVEIAPGVAMPRLGLGTYKVDEGPDVEGEVRYGLSLGYRLIDTAAMYGNERGVASAIRESGLRREEVFVTTKVWNSDQGYERTLAAFDASLERLGFDYVDLYLVHWPDTRFMHGTWRAMEEIAASGRARAIGVCNFSARHLDELLTRATIAPAVNQVEFHPRLQQPELQAFCREHGIQIQAWAPIMRGRVNDIPELVEVGARHAKTPAQVSIRWILQSGIVTIPKSVHRPRIAENCDVYDFALTSDEMDTIIRLNKEQRIGPDPDTFARFGRVTRMVEPPK
ncbi:MAG: aldo/keto reductase [Coriobacteriia bacterium]|nr:aldo/keto reductase [Coriobacteriia bacterium]